MRPGARRRSWPRGSRCWPSTTPTGRLLAEEGRDDDLEFALPPLDTIPTDDVLLLTVVEAKDEDDRHRLALRRVTIPSGGNDIPRRGRQPARTDRRRAGIAARDPRLRRPDRARHRRIRRMVSRTPEPVPCRRDGRTSAEDWRREPEWTAAGRQPARRARPAGGNLQRTARPPGSLADPAAAVHGRCVARTAHAGRDRPRRRQRRAAAAAP